MWGIAAGWGSCWEFLLEIQKFCFDFAQLWPRGLSASCGSLGTNLFPNLEGQKKILVVETDSQGSQEDSFQCEKPLPLLLFIHIFYLKHNPDYGFMPPSGFIGLPLFVGEGGSPHSFAVINAEPECHLLVALRVGSPLLGPQALGCRRILGRVKSYCHVSTGKLFTSKISCTDWPKWL